MEFILSMILCSQITGTCLDPYPMPSKYVDLYRCLQAGYVESAIRHEEIGQEFVNENKLFIKFLCQEVTKSKLDA